MLVGDANEVLDLLGKIVFVCNSILTIISLTAMVVKPIRNKIFGNEQITEGQKCLLRSEIVRTYYKNLERKQIKEYEFENMEMCYKAYVALHGNTFVKHIHDEMMEWEVIR